MGKNKFFLFNKSIVHTFIMCTTKRKVIWFEKLSVLRKGVKVIMKIKCNICNILPVILAILILIITIIITNNNPQEQKSILSLIAVPGDNTTVGTTIIKFSKNEIEIGTAMTHTVGSDTININESGIYQISYQIFGERQTFGTYNFNAVILVNGVVLDDTQNETPILKDNVINRMTKTSTVILRLNAGDTLQLGTITVEDIIFDRARIDIEKIY